MYQASHKTDILSVLNKDRDEKESYCDVILEVEGQKFPAHKCIVGNLSRFFDKVFKVEMKEKYSSSVCLEKIKSANMKTVLDFMYIGNLQLTNENVVENLEVSDYLQIDGMKSFCVDFLVKSLDQRNCLRYHALGQTFDAQRLVDAAVEVVCRNFEGVSKEKEFNELKKEDLCLIMEAVEQKTSLIQNLYTASITWINHDLDNRKQHLIDLFKLIKLHLLPTSFLEGVVVNEHLVQDSKGCLQYFVRELLHQRNISEKSLLSITSKSSSVKDVVKLSGYQGNVQWSNASVYSKKYYSSIEYPGDIEVSKELLRIVRHDKYKWIKMDKEGYIAVDDIISDHKFIMACSLLTLYDIQYVVNSNDKKRFELKEINGKWFIKATQGHTVQVEDQALTPITDPRQFPNIFHGTFFESWELIKVSGLNRMKVFIITDHLKIHCKNLAIRPLVKWSLLSKVNFIGF